MIEEARLENTKLFNSANSICSEVSSFSNSRSTAVPGSEESRLLTLVNDSKDKEESMWITGLLFAISAAGGPANPSGI